jgi:hypothetical protein
MNGADLLHEAARKVDLGWCQGTEATTVDGLSINVCSAGAARWSLLGALQAAVASDESTELRDIEMAVSALADLIDDPSLAHWNDVPSRTAGDVSDVLERAESIAGASVRGQEFRATRSQLA